MNVDDVVVASLDVVAGASESIYYVYVAGALHNSIDTIVQNELRLRLIMRVDSILGG